jgi:hypothetical protein
MINLSVCVCCRLYHTRAERRIPGAHHCTCEPSSLLQAAERYLCGEAIEPLQKLFRPYVPPI